MSGGAPAQSAARRGTWDVPGLLPTAAPADRAWTPTAGTWPAKVRKTLIAERSSSWGAQFGSRSAPILIPTKNRVYDATSPAGAREEQRPGTSGTQAVAECVRLRKLLHEQEQELVKSRKQLASLQRDMRQLQSEVDVLRLKNSNLERLERRASADLLEERHKSDELAKQVKAMSQNLLSVCNTMEGTGGDADISASQKRCFKLVQENTFLAMEGKLLRRRQGWAEAKARVLQAELQSVYLGTYDQVKDDLEIEERVRQEFSEGRSRTMSGDEATMMKLLLPMDYKHREAVEDFLTHVVQTQGQDTHGFLQSSRVFCDAIRDECISCLGLELFAHWRLNRRLPTILRALERIVHLQDQSMAFEGLGAEVAQLLGCSTAKIWMVDRARNMMWTMLQGTTAQAEPEKFTLQLPSSQLPGDRDYESYSLAGQGFAMAALVSMQTVNVTDAKRDPRYNADADKDKDRNGKSVLCVPILKAGKVKVVVQAVNKLEGHKFDAESDGRVLQLLGQVSLEVLKVCEASGAASGISKRKDALLQLVFDRHACESAAQFLRAVERSLRDLFMSQDFALHLVAPGSDTDVPDVVQGSGSPGSGSPSAAEKSGLVSSRLQVDRQSARKVIREREHPLRGLVGEAVVTLSHSSYAEAKLTSTCHDAAVDIEVPEMTVLHTVPISDAGSGACVAVCQFVCPSGQGGTADDAAYRPERNEHVRLLGYLMTFVQKNLWVLDFKKTYSDLERRAMES